MIECIFLSHLFNDDDCIKFCKVSSQSHWVVLYCSVNVSSEIVNMGIPIVAAACNWTENDFDNSPAIVCWSYILLLVALFDVIICHK